MLGNFFSLDFFGEAVLETSEIFSSELDEIVLSDDLLVIVADSE